MAFEFHPVRCPDCERHPVVGEIGTGSARFKCPDCHRRVWAISDGAEVRTVMTDMARKRVGAKLAVA